MRFLAAARRAAVTLSLLKKKESGDFYEPPDPKRQ
jgi:hypothetical protein